MKFGYIAPNFGDKISAADPLEIAVLCEEVGFASIRATDHMIMPKELREPYGEVLEPFVTLSFIRAETEKLKLGTGIIILPQRNHILVAKQAATVDVSRTAESSWGLGQAGPTRSSPT